LILIILLKILLLKLNQLYYNILKKGYAILKVNNVIVSNPSLLKIGDEIETIIKNKTLKSVIKNINESKNEE
jgi:exodeoxyribonuclease VII large subunit